MDRGRCSRFRPAHYLKLRLLLSHPRSQFLDQQPFLRTRLVQRRAVDDPFLLEVTADGIPIEEATTCDLRRGERRGERGGLGGRG